MVMVHIKNPCLNCEKRIVGCHGSCEDYKVFRKDLDAQNKRRREEKQKVRCVDDYCFETKGRRCKRKTDKVKYLRER